MSLRKKTNLALIGFFCFFTFLTFGQNQKLADSLLLLYESGNYDLKEVEILRLISEEVTDPEITLKYAELLIQKATKDSLYDALLSGYLQKGNALQLKGNFVAAIDAYYKGLEYGNQIKDLAGQGSIMISIADTYSMSGNSNNAQKYYNNGIELLRKTNDSVALASALLNAGDEYFNTQKFEEALNYFEESSSLFKKINYPIGIAYNLGNIGMVYAEQGKDILAEQNMNEAISILEETKDYYPIAVYLTYISDIYLTKSDFPTSLDYSMRSLHLATQFQLKDQISDANLQLSKIYEKAGNMIESLKYYKNHIVYRDSVTNIKAVQEMADLRTNYEVSQKQIEVNLLEKESEIQELKNKKQQSIIYGSIVVIIMIFLLAFGLYKRYKFIKKTKIIIEEEKNRSESLLLNILPAETALELKEYGKVQAKKFDSVTVLFTDFKGFTNYSEKLSPEKLVKSVDYYFSNFDTIIERHKLEKIKTIGDAYMCASGLPFPKKDHAYNMVLAALEIAAFVKEAKKNNPLHEARFDIRIGISTGPVVAGVVGIKKFAYDIWGDTVNVASRMEANSEVGKINISQNTYELVKDRFNCSSRGAIEVKNRGVLKMYYVNSLINTN